MIPNFRAQGLITEDHDLGAAMSQGTEHRLPLYTSAGTFAVTASGHYVLLPAAQEHLAGRSAAFAADHPD